MASGGFWVLLRASECFRWVLSASENACASSPSQSQAHVYVAVVVILAMLLMMFVGAFCVQQAAARRLERIQKTHPALCSRRRLSLTLALPKRPPHSHSQLTHRRLPDS